MRHGKEVDASTSQTTRLIAIHHQTAKEKEDRESTVDVHMSEIPAADRRSDWLQEMGGPALDAADTEIHEAATAMDHAYERCILGVTVSLRLAFASIGAWGLGFAPAVVWPEAVWPVVVLSIILAATIGMASWRIRRLIQLGRECCRVDRAHTAALTRRRDIVDRITEG